VDSTPHEDLAAPADLQRVNTIQEESPLNSRSFFVALAAAAALGATAAPAAIAAPHASNPPVCNEAENSFQGGYTVAPGTDPNPPAFLRGEQMALGNGHGVGLVNAAEHSPAKALCGPAAGDSGSTGGDSGSTGGDSGSTGGDSGSTGGDTGSTGGDTGGVIAT
jgi:hypothetical protein